MPDEKFTRAGTIVVKGTAVSSGGHFTTAGVGKSSIVTTGTNSKSVAAKTLVATFDSSRGFQTKIIEVPFDATSSARRSDNIRANRASSPRSDTSESD